MPAPSITGIGVGRILEAITAQHMKDFILDGFNRRRKIRNPMLRIRIKADHHGVGEKLGDLLVTGIGLENLAIDGGQEILSKAADGFGRAG